MATDTIDYETEQQSEMAVIIQRTSVLISELRAEGLDEMRHLIVSGKHQLEQKRKFLAGEGPAIKDFREDEVPTNIEISNGNIILITQTGSNEQERVLQVTTPENSQSSPWSQTYVVGRDALDSVTVYQPDEGDRCFFTAGISPLEG